MQIQTIVVKFKYFPFQYLEKICCKCSGPVVQSLLPRKVKNLFWPLCLNSAL